jgi:hypothetical protein
LLLQPTLHLALTTMAAGPHHHHHGFHDASANWVMVAAHVVAAAVAAWWISAADALLMRLAWFVQDLGRKAWPVRLDVSPLPCRIRLGRDAPVASGAFLTGSLNRRGPPVALVA